MIRSTSHGAGPLARAVGVILGLSLGGVFGCFGGQILAGIALGTTLRFAPQCTDIDWPEVVCISFVVLGSLAGAGLGVTVISTWLNDQMQEAVYMALGGGVGLVFGSLLVSSVLALCGGAREPILFAAICVFPSTLAGSLLGVWLQRRKSDR